MSVFRRSLKYVAWVVGALLLIVLTAFGYGWAQMRGSLPQLAGTRALAGLGAPVKIERDSLGVPLITAASRVDVARALGFLHAQDRFFQMDLLRRVAAGELAEIFGRDAVAFDQTRRRHRFRVTAGRVLESLPPGHRELLEAYTAGVNAGLTALPRIPWEYLVLRVPPQVWRAEDSILCAYAMWFDLQDATGGYERSLQAFQLAHGTAALNFFAPRGNSWDAALDGSTFEPPPFPPLKIKRETTPARTTARPVWDDRALPGSNNFALAGRHTATGAAMFANDMHLNLSVPNTWYRAAFAWMDGAGPHRVVGVTLPGLPLMVVGSNGRVAWGFTNSYVDTTDIVVVEHDNTGLQYRAPAGWVFFQNHPETIRVKNGEPVTFEAQWTEWGPIIAPAPAPEKGRLLALRWNAHDPAATNLGLLAMETVGAAAEAIAVGRRAGMPNQNLLVADHRGAIAWTVTGLLPRRRGFDGRLPVSWAYGDRAWEDWWSPDETPGITDPAEGYLWTANNRVAGGEAYAKLGDGGYDEGPRAGQIRDGLKALVASGRKAAPADLFAIQLDDRALFLARWKELLLCVLSDEAVAQKKARGKLRDEVLRWSGHASTDSAAYRIVRAFRTRTTARVLGPFFEQPGARYPGFAGNRLLTEDAVWRLIEEKPAALLNAEHTSWEALLLAAADEVLDEAQKAGGPDEFTWGRRNTLRMQHPFGRFLPGSVARFLDMPYDQMPGDSNMPRVQTRGFGASQRLVVCPGHEEMGILHLPGGQSGHPLSPYYRAGHAAWVKGEPTPLLPGPARHTLTLTPP